MARRFGIDAVHRDGGLRKPEVKVAQSDRRLRTIKRSRRPLQEVVQDSRNVEADRHPETSTDPGTRLQFRRRSRVAEEDRRNWKRISDDQLAAVSCGYFRK